MKEKKQVVVVGGGTGTHTILSGLKHYTKHISLSAIVTMADSGGSTGRLRDEFGQLPAGDVRNALTALAAESDDHEALLRRLFLYRFDRGTGLDGHNFGNLFLTVLTDILGDEVAAIEAASTLLRVEGKVIPVTTDQVHLKAIYEDGLEVVGEHGIDEISDHHRRALRIKELSLTPEATITEAARMALAGADLIIFGPGDLYTSILANCVVAGFKEALAESKAKVIYVSNLMSKAGQTVGFHTAEHHSELVRYSGKVPDYLLFNTDPLPPDLLAKYQEEGDHPVENNYLGQETVVRALPLLATEVIKTVRGDSLKRSLIRHDAHKLAAAALECLSL